MCATASTERRRHKRHPLSTGLRLLHGPSEREFPSRGIDMSVGGMLMYVPATAPVNPGQRVGLRFEKVDRRELSAFSERTVPANIVRVDRRTLLTAGQLTVGVQFDNEA